MCSPERGNPSKGSNTKPALEAYFTGSCRDSHKLINNRQHHWEHLCVHVWAGASEVGKWSKEGLQGQMGTSACSCTLGMAGGMHHVLLIQESQLRNQSQHRLLSLATVRNERGVPRGTINHQACQFSALNGWKLKPFSAAFPVIGF